MENMTLKQWRRVKDLTIEEMAKACGVHPNTYAAWERNPDKVRIGDAVKVASILGVDVDAIFFKQ